MLENNLAEQDVFFFREGTHSRLYQKMGAHLVSHKGKQGTVFSVWAPNAEAVSVIGDFNGWDAKKDLLQIRCDSSGIWEGFFPKVKKGMRYKYHITSKIHGYSVEKGDPFGFLWEVAPKTASVVTDLSYDWHDTQWMRDRHQHNALDAPLSIYEIHLGSWKRIPEEANRFLSYRELADCLVHYLLEMKFTHVEFLPITEHPFYGSWGYQSTGFFAPTSRYGTPQDLMYLIDCLHQNGIGVILDWVPSHFPGDQHGLSFFDGTHLFEHADPKQGIHPDWGSILFNYGRNEVQSFLISASLFWLDKYHFDGLRLDAVASMLYLDYSRNEGEWIPNRYGGRENLEAISFLKRLNESIYQAFPDVQVMAEESTSWPMVSRPTYLGGLGFGLKWNMGWMHDTLSYISKDAVHRKYHHGELTFSMIYAFTENFVLPLSHDEVVHGKGALLDQMPGETWEKFANLRLLLGYMYGHPGKKLLFMGNEFGQWQEWHHDRSLDWHLLEEATHQGLQSWVKDLNRFYVREKSLHKRDFDATGFEWIDNNDQNQSVISFLRCHEKHDDSLLFICNFTPVQRDPYQIGVPVGGFWEEVLNSNALTYGGNGAGNLGGHHAVQRPSHGRPWSIKVILPPLSVVVFRKNESEGTQHEHVL